jgi:hypothetical protein
LLLGITGKPVGRAKLSFLYELNYLPGELAAAAGAGAGVGIGAGASAGNKTGNRPVVLVLPAAVAGRWFCFRCTPLLLLCTPLLLLLITSVSASVVSASVAAAAFAAAGNSAPARALFLPGCCGCFPV